jgi:polo-like kinase 1
MLLVGKPPFESADQQTTFSKIRIIDFTFPHDIKLSDEAKAFVRALLISNPTERMTHEQILRSKFLMGPESLPEKLPVEFIRTAPTKEYIYNSIFCVEKRDEVEEEKVKIK